MMAGVGFQAQIVLLDFLRLAQQQRGKPARQRRFADALGSGKQQSLRDAPALDHVSKRGCDIGVSEEVFQA